MKEKETWIAYILLITMGYFGAHKFYLGKTGMGIFYMCTAGGFVFGAFIDLFTLPNQVKLANR